MSDKNITKTIVIEPGQTVLILEEKSTELLFEALAIAELWDGREFQARILEDSPIIKNILK